MAFAFGLVHGFGFAGLLADLLGDIHGSAVVGPLLFFNFGVEAGQLLVVLLVLPLLIWARRVPCFLAYAQPIGSVTVAAFGAIWFFQRI